MDPYGPGYAPPRDPEAADESDLRVLRGQAVKLYEIITQPAVMQVVGVSSANAAMAAATLLGAMMLGKLRADAEANPETFVANFMPLLEKELEFVASSAQHDRKAQLATNGAARFEPITELRLRSELGAGYALTGRGGDS
jgi:hypothetical protein